jgi:phosphoribosylamine---glycine ligase
MPKIWVLGGGGREHALVKAIRRTTKEAEVWCAPGNAGIAKDATLADVLSEDPGTVAEWAVAQEIDLVVVGPESPLVVGVSDALEARGVPVLGCSKAAAQLEGSKTFAKTVMMDAKVPTARWRSCERAEDALAFVDQLGEASVLKADGLCAGKGVVVCDRRSDAEVAVREFFGNAQAAPRMVVEERMFGEELSVIALCDGRESLLFPPSQDHKRIFEGDLGPNTGGMGAYSPPPAATASLLDEAKAVAIDPVLRWMEARGMPFRGILYAGLMLTTDGPRVLEYNVRFGDPEAQAILPRVETNLFELFLAAARGDLSGHTLRVSKKAALTVVLAARDYPGTPRKGDVIEGLDAVEEGADLEICHAGTRQQGGHFVTNGGRVLSVTGLGASLAEAATRAYEAVGKIEWDGIQYRRDIGARALGYAPGAVG